MYIAKFETKYCNIAFDSKISLQLLIKYFGDAADLDLRINKF